MTLNDSSFDKSHILFFVAAILIGGCGKTSPVGEAGPAPAKVPSQEAAENFARQIESDIQDPSGKRVELFDWERVYAHCIEGVSIPRKERQKLKDSFLEGTRSHGLVSQIQQQVKAGGTYQFLRIRKVGSEMHAVFRMEAPTGELNYHEFDLVEDASGRIRAEDVYIYLSGEKLSKTMRPIFLQIAGQLNRGLLDRLAGRDKVLIKTMPKLQSMQQELKAGRPLQTLATYNSLPEDVKKMKFVMIVRLMAAARSESQAEYMQAVQEYQNLFPNDPSLLLISVDYYLIKKQFDKAIETIDRLDKAVGGDPSLDGRRSNIYRQAGNIPKALEFERRAAAHHARKT